MTLAVITYSFNDEPVAVGTVTRTLTLYVPVRGTIPDSVAVFFVRFVETSHENCGFVAPSTEP